MSFSTPPRELGLFLPNQMNIVASISNISYYELEYEVPYLEGALCTFDAPHEPKKKRILSCQMLPSIEHHTQAPQQVNVPSHFRQRGTVTPPLPRQ